METGQARIWGASAFPSGRATPSTGPQVPAPSDHAATAPTTTDGGQFTDSAPPKVRTAKAPAPPRRLALLLAVAMGTAVLPLRQPQRSKHFIPASLDWPCLLRPFTLGNRQLPAFPPELDRNSTLLATADQRDAGRMLEVGGGRLGLLPLLQRKNCLPQTYCVLNFPFRRGTRDELTGDKEENSPAPTKRTDGFKWLQVMGTHHAPRSSYPKHTVSSLVNCMENQYFSTSLTPTALLSALLDPRFLHYFFKDLLLFL